MCQPSSIFASAMISYSPSDFFSERKTQVTGLSMPDPSASALASKLLAFEKVEEPDDDPETDVSSVSFFLPPAHFLFRQKLDWLKSLCFRRQSFYQLE